MGGQQSDVNSVNSVSKKYTMSMYLIVCCLVAVLTSSMQIGYQVAVLNMPHESLDLLIQNKTFLFKAYFDGLKTYDEGFSWYSGNKTLLQQSEEQLEESKSKYLECTFTWDEPCKEEILKNKEIKEEEIFVKYGKRMTVDEALEMGREKLKEAEVKLADGRKKLAEGLQKVHRVSKLIYLFLNCTLFIGALIGALVAKLLLGSTDNSRKKSLLVHYSFCMLASILGFVAYGISSPMCLLASRLLFGLHVGLASVLVPIYLSEISPRNSRGSILSLHYLGIAFGLLVAQLVSSPNLLGTQDLAYLLFALPVVPSLIGLLGSLLFLTDTPHNFLFKNDRVTARNMLERLRSSESDIDQEISEIENDNNPLFFDQSLADIKMATRSPVSVRSADTNATPVTSFIQFLKLKYMFVLFSGCFLINMAQQLGGFYYIFFYSSHLFKRIFDPKEDRNYCILTISTGLTHLAGSLLGTLLIDRLGRKMIFVYASLFSLLDLLVLAILTTTSEETNPIIVFVLILFNVFFVGLIGATAIAYTVESFRLNVKNTAVSYCMFFYWLVGLFYCFVYSILEIRNEAKPFVLFLLFAATAALTTSVLAIFLRKRLPETNNKTVLQILDCYQASSKRDENESLMTAKA